METSGVFLMARNKDAQANLGKQFERRKVEKTYIARVYEHLPEDEGLINLPLRCDWDNRPKQMVCYDHGKPSQTHWRVLSREDGDMPITRLELKPITGRSHQLRVHLAEIGHPILGEPFYANDEILHAVPRLQLHAQDLTIHHPDGGARITFTDPCPF
jgi:tRNA pseudouridine32 synthase/23S rRNA pseudouridine746 synthase